jgi:hypothetical protein
MLRKRHHAASCNRQSGTGANLRLCLANTRTRRNERAERASAAQYATARHRRGALRPARYTPKNRRVLSATIRRRLGLSRTSVNLNNDAAKHFGNLRNDGIA